LHFAAFHGLLSLITQLVLLLPQDLDFLVKSGHVLVKDFLGGLFDAISLGWQFRDFRVSSKFVVFVFREIHVVEFIHPRVGVLVAVITVSALTSTFSRLITVFSVTSLIRLVSLAVATASAFFASSASGTGPLVVSGVLSLGAILVFLFKSGLVNVLGLDSFLVFGAH